MHHFRTIAEYYNAIGNTPPDCADFDIRSFAENEDRIATHMPAFRHEFYVIAIRISGEGRLVSGQYTDLPEGMALYFNSPFQLQSWESTVGWSGYYLIFSQNFLTSSHYFDHILDDFPFLKIDQSQPLQIEQQELPQIQHIYQRIKEEFASNEPDKMSLIEVYVLELLNQIKRLYRRKVGAAVFDKQKSKTDFVLLSRFQELLGVSFASEARLVGSVNLHSPAYYASLLGVHPNHLNAVSKSITGLTASSQIHDYLMKMAKAQLAQTDASAKEIAYNLHFSSPNKFSAFFKRHAGITPLTYRKNIQSLK